MGIRFSCPNGHKLHVKEYLAGKRGVCPNCGAKVLIPSAQGSQASPSRAVAAAVRASASPASARAGAEGSTAAPAGSAPDPSSQSIVISIVEPSRAPLARPAASPPSAVPEPVTSPAPDLAPGTVAAPREVGSPPNVAPPSMPGAAAPPPLAAGEPADVPTVEAGSAEPAANATTLLPVSQYVAQRNRSRRNQTRLAVVLLIAVVALAVALLVVLRNQGTSAGETDVARVDGLFSHPDTRWLAAEPPAMPRSVAVTARMRVVAAHSALPIPVV